MLNKVRIMTGIMIIAGVMVWLVGGQIAAGSTTPGTVNDPLVTKSYVDLKVAELKIELTAFFDDVEPGSPIVSEDVEDEDDVTPVTDEGLTMDDVKAYVNAQLMTNDATSSDEDASESASEDESAELFVVVQGTNNQSLICGASAEVILRAGSARVIAGAEGDGLANLTTGEDLRSGSEVPLQNHLLVSRDDGRGLLITSDDTYILVKGDYRLE